MGTAVTVRVVCAEGSLPGDAEFGRALGWFREVERCCSRFDPESDLQRLCRQAGTAVTVPPLLLRAIHFATEVAARSQGALDPTVGGALHRAGYDRHHATGDVVPVIDGPGTWRDIHCDLDAGTVTLERPMQLDLGAVAKGLAVDLAAAALDAWPNLMIDAGGDVLVRGTNPDGVPWRVGVRDPHRPDRLATTLPLTDVAACTSGTYERGTHLVDPRLGTAPTGLSSVTVLAPSAMVADATSTAAFVLGVRDGAAFLEREGLRALLIDGAGHVTRVGTWDA